MYIILLFSFNSNSSGLIDASNCTACEGGLVCKGVALKKPNSICSSGYFCRSGAYTEKPADAGATGDPCTKGHYCPEGTGKFFSESDMSLVLFLIRVCFIFCALHVFQGYLHIHVHCTYMHVWVYMYMYNFIILTYNVKLYAFM